MTQDIFPVRQPVREAVGKDLPNFVAHSGVPVHEKEEYHSRDTTNTALQFAEGITAANVSYSPARDETFLMSENEDIGLHDMLSRPQRILGLEWNIGDTLSIPGGAMSVLSFILKNKRVVNRINNFAFLNGTVHIRVVVSGVPQHFGLGMISLNPWFRQDSNKYYKGGFSGPTYNQMVQLPHVFIDPSTSSGGEMSLPLIMPTNALFLSDEDAVNEAMGINVMSFGPLGTVTLDATPVTVNVWAWMSDVILSNPLSENLPYLQAQSGDEYGIAPVSKFASTLAKWSEYFEYIPVIGNYAKASTMMFSTTAKIAELFGYSRPNASKSEVKFQHSPLGNLVHYNFEDSTTKLTLDSKAEVTIDPSVSGIRLGDEMAISSIVTREGYLGSFTWKSENTSSQPIARFCVMPTLTRQVTSTGVLPHTDDVYDFTPLGFTALAFRRWRGTIRFRFVVACSAFHKGRLRFVFDAGSLLDNDGAWNHETNVNQSYVLDLSEKKEITIDIPWATWVSYLDVQEPLRSAPFPYYDLSQEQLETLSPNRLIMNGLLGVHVLVPLASPSSLADVRIHTFISGGPDFEFQEPGNGFANYIFGAWEPQSGKEDLGADILTGNDVIATQHANPHDVLGTKEKAYTDKLAEIHFGERIVSIRQLIKRYVHHSHTKILVSDNWAHNHVTNTDFPSYKGYDLAARGASEDGDPYNFARDSYLAYFALPFLGYRGSIRQKYYLNFSKTGDFISLAGSRSDFVDDGIAVNGIAGSFSMIANVINSEHDARLGTVVTNPNLNNVVEFETPYYSPYRFMFAKIVDKYGDRSGSYGKRFTRHKVSIIGKNPDGLTFLTRYVAAGDDFQYIFFKYAPCGVNKGNATPNPSD
jgi:hypothetical protein